MVWLAYTINIFSFCHGLLGKSGFICNFPFLRLNPTYSVLLCLSQPKMKRQPSCIVGQLKRGCRRFETPPRYEPTTPKSRPIFQLKITVSTLATRMQRKKNAVLSRDFESKGVCSNRSAACKQRVGFRLPASTALEQRIARRKVRPYRNASQAQTRRLQRFVRRFFVAFMPPR